VTLVSCWLLVNVRLLEVLSPGDKITLMLVVDHVILGWLDAVPSAATAGEATTGAAGASVALGTVPIANWLKVGGEASKS